MEIIKEKAVCFTGHRPEKIVSVLQGDEAALRMLKSMLFYQIHKAIEDGFEYFISGLARGVDIWAAQYVLELKKKYPKIKLIGAKPYEEHGRKFKGQDLWELTNVISGADMVVDVTGDYSRDCYSKRNRYMVDNSSRIIAVVSDYKSGTGQTISYANKKKLDVKLIKVDDFVSENYCENLQKQGIYRFT